MSCGGWPGVAGPCGKRRYTDYNTLRLVCHRMSLCHRRVSGHRLSPGHCGSLCVSVSGHRRSLGGALRVARESRETAHQHVPCHSMERAWNSNMQPMHYDVIMGTMVSQITSLMIVYSTFYSGADHRKHQSSASLAFVRGIHRWPVNSLHKGPVMRKMFPFDDVIMRVLCQLHLPIE